MIVTLDANRNEVNRFPLSVSTQSLIGDYLGRAVFFDNSTMKITYY